MNAESTSWKREPFREGVPVPYSALLTPNELERIKTGYLPREMEDKWFIYYEAPYLFIHRSWTGLPVYRLKLVVQEMGASVEEALWSVNGASEEEKAYEALFVDFLVSNLLLGKEKPFPEPPGVRKQLPGARQHHNSLTRYVEKMVRAKKPWWKLW